MLPRNNSAKLNRHFQGIRTDRARRAIRGQSLPERTGERSPNLADPRTKTSGTCLFHRVAIPAVNGPDRAGRRAASDPSFSAQSRRPNHPKPSGRPVFPRRPTSFDRSPGQSFCENVETGADRDWFVATDTSFDPLDRPARDERTDPRTIVSTSGNSGILRAIQAPIRFSLPLVQKGNPPSLLKLTMSARSA